MTPDEELTKEIEEAALALDQTAKLLLTSGISPIIVGSVLVELLDRVAKMTPNQPHLRELYVNTFYKLGEKDDPKHPDKT